MIYEIDTSNQNRLDWNAKGNDRILQNVYNLISTCKYEIAYARLVGIDATLIDKPVTEVEGLLTAQILEQIDRFEPRAKFISADFECGIYGDLVIRVVVDI